MNVVALIQARMTSRRLPGKVLHQISDKPLLQYIIESLKRCNLLNGFVVVTSSEESDDPIADYCKKIKVRCFRGPLKNVASRFICAIETYKIDACVRVCGDSPLLDYRLIDKAVGIYRKNKYDIVTNVLKRTFPKGFSVEIVNSQVLSSTYPLMKSENHKEHVTSFFYENSSRFNIHNFESEVDYNNLQYSVDTPEDMERFKRIIKAMNKAHWEYGFEELMLLNQSLFL